MSVAVTVKFDDRALQEWGAACVKQLSKNLRSAVDRSAREARRDAIKVMQADSLVPLARFRKAVPTVQGTRAGSLVAKWVISASPNNIRAAGGGTIASIPRDASVQVSTFAQSGGGSADLTLRKAFIINSNGGRIISIRIGKGRSAIRGVYAEMPNTAMTGGRKPQLVWMKTAQTKLAQRIPDAVERAFGLTASAPPSMSDDGGTA